MHNGQMTIFYCGKVNVYDDVPADKVLKLLLPYLEVVVTLLYRVNSSLSSYLIRLCCVSWIFILVWNITKTAVLLFR